MTPQEPYEIHRRVLQVLLLDIHRASVQAKPATRAGVNLRLRHTLPRMVRLDPGVSQKNPQHLGQNVHVPAERHSHEEKTEADRIRPPARREPKLIPEEKVPETIDTHSQETASTEIRRETLRQKPQREYQPKAVQGDTVGKRGFRGVSHPEDDGPEPLEHRQSYTRQDVQEEEVHQEEEERAPQGRVTRIHPDKVPVEYRIEQTTVGHAQALGHEQGDLDVPQNDYHEPTESYRGVHIAQQGLPAPNLKMQEAIPEKIFQIPDYRLGDEKRLEES